MPWRNAVGIVVLSGGLLLPGSRAWAFQVIGAAEGAEAEARATEAKPQPPAVRDAGQPHPEVQPPPAIPQPEPAQAEPNLEQNEELHGAAEGEGGVEAARQWLREQLAAGISSQRLLERMHARVDQMSPEQLSRAVALQRRKLARQQQEAREAQVRRQQAEAFWNEMRLEAAREAGFQTGFRRGYRYGYWDGYAPPWYGGVGYAPVVTWLPSGTQFSVGGVVSPGGRYLRMHAAPFFSSVGPVTPFHVIIDKERRQEQPKPEVWYDGLRTRYGIRPDR